MELTGQTLLHEFECVSNDCLMLSLVPPITIFYMPAEAAYVDLNIDFLSMNASNFCVHVLIIKLDLKFLGNYDSPNWS